jgi:hypothetical protein
MVTGTATTKNTLKPVASVIEIPQPRITLLLIRACVHGRGEQRHLKPLPAREVAESEGLAASRGKRRGSGSACAIAVRIFAVCPVEGADEIGHAGPVTAIVIL